MRRGNGGFERKFRQYRTNQRLYKTPVYKSEYWCPINSEHTNSLPAISRNENTDVKLRSMMSIKRMTAGMIGLVFARKLQEEGLSLMTESRVYRIETGRAVATDQERNAIVRLLGPGLFEISRNYLGKLEYKIKMCEPKRGEDITAIISATKEV